MKVVYHGNGCADQCSPDRSSATPERETQVSMELGLIVPGKTSLIIPQLRGIIRAIRTAWFTKPIQHLRDKQTGRKMENATE